MLSARRALLTLVVVSGLALGAASPAHADPPTPVHMTVSSDDSGASSEQVAALPLYLTGSWASSYAKAVYSVPVTDLAAGEVLKLNSDLELATDLPYTMFVSAKIILATSATATSGTVISPYTSMRIPADMPHVTFPKVAAYRASAAISGTRYVNVVLEAGSEVTLPGDEIDVVPDHGRLQLTRFTPTTDTSLPGARLQALVQTGTEPIASVGTNTGWQVVASQEVGTLAAADVLDVAGEASLKNATGRAQRVRSKIIVADSATATTGYNITGQSEEISVPDTQHFRLEHAAALATGLTTSAGSKYVNLITRVDEVAPGTTGSVAVAAGTSSLSVLRFLPTIGDPAQPVSPASTASGTQTQTLKNTEVPWSESTDERRVIYSTALNSLRPGEIVRAHAAVTVEVANRTDAHVQLGLVLGSSATDVDGPVVATTTGNSIPDGGRFTLFKEGTYTVPTNVGTKYLNAVVLASGAPTSLDTPLSVLSGYMSQTRLSPLRPLVADFETGGGLDQYTTLAVPGRLSIVSSPVREGTKALEVTMQAGDKPIAGEPTERAELVPPDLRGAGGYVGEDDWYGWSTYFPTAFAVAPDGSWNTFAQWHHNANDTPCTPTFSAPPPVGFNARLVSGEERLEVSIRGGEIGTDCTLDGPGHDIDRVLYTQPTPLVHDVWHDFVLHITWSSDPAVGAAQVWIDGTKVIDEAHTATLYSHGTDKGKVATLAFGLYRDYLGPTGQPSSTLYTDGMRRGNSYSDVAPECVVRRQNGDFTPCP